MKEVVSVLTDYFAKELPLLAVTYSWRIPELAGFHLSGRSDYASNVELKKFFHDQWHGADEGQKTAVAKAVVADWGGVRSNRDSTLLQYVNLIKSGVPNTPIKGVASYSKILAVVDMQRYAIYDARVAACLNAVQWNKSIGSGVAFNYISGRNNVVGHAGKKIGFVHEDAFKVRALVHRGWKNIKRDDTYKVYLDVLHECLRSLPGAQLHDLEMILFANAEKECSKALSSLKA